MRILRIGPDHYIIESQRDAETVALKLLNERRIFMDPDSPKRKFVEEVCDAMDGQTALVLIAKEHNVQFIEPKVI